MAIVSPWIALIGSYIARQPAKLQRQLQRDSRVEQEIYHLETQAKIENAKAANEEARKNRKLEEAKRTQLAEEIGPDAVETLRRERAAAIYGEASEIRELSEIDKFTIMMLGNNPSAVNLNKLNVSPDVIAAFQEIVPGATQQRFKIDIDASLRGLENLGITEPDGYRNWALTSKGYKEFDQLSS